jgi:hypothetical protein
VIDLTLGFGQFLLLKFIKKLFAPEGLINPQAIANAKILTIKIWILQPARANDQI